MAKENMFRSSMCVALLAMLTGRTFGMFMRLVFSPPHRTEVPYPNYSLTLTGPVQSVAGGTDYPALPTE